MRAKYWEPQPKGDSDKLADEHPEYTVHLWTTDVLTGTTRESYVDWVNEQIEKDIHESREGFYESE